MTNGTEFSQSATYTRPITETVAIDANGVGTLSNTPVASTVSVRGFVQAAAVAAGKFVIDGDEIKFDSSDVASTNIPVSYYYTESAYVAEIDNKSSAVGEAVLIYPVYAGGDECTNGSFDTASIIGHVIMKVYKCRVTQQPGLDGSYKSASTFAFTLSALDPKRNDDKTSANYVRVA